jgi:hypothetical protein
MVSPSETVRQSNDPWSLRSVVCPARRSYRDTSYSSTYSSTHSPADAPTHSIFWL